MKKIAAAFVIMSSLFISVLYADHDSLVPYREGNKCGYADRDLKIIVKPQYDACGDMIDGMASVYVNGKYGFIDKNGKTVIHPLYNYSTSFNSGYAIMAREERYTVIDSSGSQVIALTDYIINFYQKGAAVISKDYKYGLMNDSGKIILPVKYGDVKPAGNGLFIVAEAPAEGSYFLGKHYLYNSSGTPAVKEGYDLIYPAASGFMMIKNGDKWGYMNPEGGVISLPIYENIRNIKYDGTACFRKNGKWGVMNGQGKIIVAAQYDNVGGGDGTMAEEMQAGQNYFTVSAGGKWGMISLRGETIAPIEYYMIGSGNSGYIPAYKEINDKSGERKVLGLTLIDSKGWELFKPRSEYNTTGEEGDGLLPAGQLGAYGRGKVMGYINHQGEMVITMVFEEAGRFEGGYAIVKKNGLYGITNKTGWMVEEAKYDDITRSSNYPGLFEGSLNGKKVYFEAGGKHFWK